MIRRSDRNSNREGKSQFSIIFVLASQYRSHSVPLDNAVHRPRWFLSMVSCNRIVRDRKLDNRKRHLNCGSLYFWTEHWKVELFWIHFQVCSLLDCFFFRIFLLRLRNTRICVFHSYLLLGSLGTRVLSLKIKKPEHRIALSLTSSDSRFGARLGLPGANLPCVCVVITGPLVCIILYFSFSTSAIYQPSFSSSVHVSFPLPLEGQAP